MDHYAIYLKLISTKSTIFQLKKNRKPEHTLLCPHLPGQGGDMEGKSDCSCLLFLSVLVRETGGYGVVSHWGLLRPH